MSATVIVTNKSLYADDSCLIESKGSRVVMFADDTDLVFWGLSWEAVINLDNLVLKDVINPWFANNMFNLHVGKTVCVFVLRGVISDIDFLGLVLHEHECARQGCRCEPLVISRAAKYLEVFADCFLF